MLRKVLSMLLAITAVLAAAGYVSAEEYSYTYSDYLYQPAPVVPAFALPGESFELYVKEGVSVSSIEAVSVLHGPYQLEIQGTSPGEDGMTVVKVKTPDDIAPDTYFLLIKTDKGTLVLPNGLKVFKEWPKELKLAWTSDTHVTTGAKIGYVCGDYFQSNIYKLEEMCSNPIPLHSVVATYSAYLYWGMNGATLMINTGDEVDTSGDMVGYKIMFDITKDTSAADMPVVGIKGNHDDPPTVYTQLLGPKYFYVTIGKFIIIGLDTGGDQGYPTEDQLDWMEKVLEEHKDYTPIILYHHPYFFDPRWNYLGGVLKGLDPDADWDQIKGHLRRSWSSQEEISKRFLEDIVKYNVPLTMSGHIHHDMYWLYIDKNGNKHYFLTLTSTGAPDKEPNPPANPKHSPTWYGSNLVVIKEDGSVEMPYVNVEIKDDKVQSDFMSVPVPQRFMAFRHVSEAGTAVKFINQLDESVSGPIVLPIPEGAKVDPEATNITYTVLGERQIADQYYIMLNVTIPQGVSQLVIDTGADTEKPVVQIAYLQPSHPKPNANFMAYFTAQDNLGIRDLYAVIYDENGNRVKYGKVDKFPGEPSSGKPGDTFYIVQLPGLEEGKYKIEIVAEDFHGNRATATKEITITSTSKAAKTTTAKQTSSEGKSTCGPAALVGLAVVPLLLRRRK
ncbi:metallophosphoesterase, calcineurin superfamily [Thermococcus kodakarensis KOD1]|uniref:Metallophosphoesterase, calcineurin superfamily n=1 Tax=Thermococcus kodakarensis (strain ATCC BAA-918 / JCM 12380 / KOD1) TaxID=69014 RepID=Q5JF57_THEKO|nr:CGP-CTERM sorting domain-containing protein [Thermococcus kodakarensis]WCN28621.1 CGP-CTERM sorting domain-containing protein [Thermococcus kodakarensis]WCN30919.1 CGP-CTERM sorting domain-containing protein [Thermococcus kodakarensis]BAD84763.1 metallophosphoesterase, calcineurin superfamily [Thermococcus kodakarensis KOD1]